MRTATHTLRYDGSEYDLTAEDHRRLRKIFTSGLAISCVLFEFTPVGQEIPVEIAVGGGTPLTLTPSSAR